jgi:prevent-host-death family protein
MKTLPVSEVKTHLSALLKEVEAGKEIAISFGKQKETIAVIVPYSEYKNNKKRVLGTLKVK